MATWLWIVFLLALQGRKRLVMETKETCCALVLGYNPENSTVAAKAKKKWWTLPPLIFFFVIA